MDNYGKELILDLHNCNSKKFTRYQINKFFKELCKKIDMQPCKLTWWDYKNHQKEYENAPAHLKGISAVQFISTSNITIHTLDELKYVFLNIFTCGDFDALKVMIFAQEFFEGEMVKNLLINRI